MSSPADSLLQNLAKKDFLTYQHSIAVSETLKEFALNLGLSDEQAQEVALLGSIHDASKVHVPDEVFRKAQNGQALSKKERQSLRFDPQVILDAFPEEVLPPDVVQGLLHMHCHWDGSGSPKQSGEDIHPYSRMLAIIDWQDLLSRQRPGRKALNEEQIFTILRKLTQRRFDPRLVERFIEWQSQRGKQSS